jgi:hypothetical protein
MKKFSENEILTSTLKVYPKVKIFANNGNIYYNNTAKSGPELSDFLLNLVSVDNSIPSTAIFTETNNALLSEDGDFIIIE